jgi:hypothetical protein
MSRSRGKRIKTMGAAQYHEDNVFYMSLEEAKELISNKYEFLQERYERRKPRRVKPTG